MLCERRKFQGSCIFLTTSIEAVRVWVNSIPPANFPISNLLRLWSEDFNPASMMFLNSSLYFWESNLVCTVQARSICLDVWEIFSFLFLLIKMKNDFFINVICQRSYELLFISLHQLISSFCFHQLEVPLENMIRLQYWNYWNEILYRYFVGIFSPHTLSPLHRR